MTIRNRRLAALALTGLIDGVLCCFGA